MIPSAVRHTPVYREVFESNFPIGTLRDKEFPPCKQGDIDKQYREDEAERNP